MNDPVEEKSKLVLDALQYAQTNNLDINKHADVQKILEALDKRHKENAEDFIELLKNADAFMEVTTKSKEPDENLPN